MSSELATGVISGVVRASVVEVTDGGRGMIVSLREGRRLSCSILRVSDELPLQAVEGDEVLVYCDEADDLGILLGIVGSGSRRNNAPSEREPPEELLIEAKDALTLRVGDGSITIRADGKILIKGKDLVSHAKRLNRIRGGSVQIN